MVFNVSNDFDVPFALAIVVGCSTYHLAFVKYCKRKFHGGREVTKEEASRTKYWLYCCALGVILFQTLWMVFSGTGAHFGLQDDAKMTVPNKQLAARQHSSAALMALHIFACSISLEMLLKANVSSKTVWLLSYALPLGTYLLVSCQMTMTNMGWSSDFTPSWEARRWVKKAARGTPTFTVVYWLSHLLYSATNFTQAIIVIRTFAPFECLWTNTKTLRNTEEKQQFRDQVVRTFLWHGNVGYFLNGLWAIVGLCGVPNPLSFLGGERFLIKPVVKGISSNIAELHRGGFIDLTFTLVAGKVCSIFDEKGFLPAKIATFQVSANLYVFFVVQALHIAIDGAVWAHPTWINRSPDLGDGRRSQLYSGIVPLDLLYWVGTFNFAVATPPIATFFMWKYTGSHRDKISRSSKKPFQDIYTRFIRAGISYMMLSGLWMYLVQAGIPAPLKSMHYIWPPLNLDYKTAKKHHQHELLNGTMTLILAFVIRELEDLFDKSKEALRVTERLQNVWIPSLYVYSIVTKVQWFMGTTGRFNVSWIDLGKYTSGSNFKVLDYLLYASYFYHKFVAFGVLCHFFWTVAKLRREDFGAGTEAKKRR